MLGNADLMEDAVDGGAEEAAEEGGQPNGQPNGQPSDQPNDPPGGQVDWSGAYTALLAAYIELVWEQPGLVPELVQGTTLAEVQASVEAARAAYSRIAALMSQGQPGTGSGGPVQPAAATGLTVASGGGARGANGNGESMGRATNRPAQRPDPVAMLARHYAGK